MINRGNMQNFSKNRAVVFPEWPQWDEHERKNLMRALQNRNWGTLGPMAMEFARRFAEYVGAAHAIPVNSGTQAMQILLGGAPPRSICMACVPEFTGIAWAAPTYSANRLANSMAIGPRVPQFRFWSALIRFLRSCSSH